MAERFRTALVDDEPPARAGLRALIASDPELLLVGEFGSVEAAVASLRAAPAELLFLDVQLGRRQGFELLDELGASRPSAIVFTTAYEEHALRAFDVAAVDYLLKPFDDQRFARALCRAKQHLNLERARSLAQQLSASLGPSTAEAGLPLQPQAAGTLTIREGANAQLIPLDRIDWIAAQDYYVEVHVGEESHLLRESLASLAQRLPPGRFLRVHRSAIVQLDRVRQVRGLPSGEAVLVLSTGATVPVSRARREELRLRLGL